MEKKNKIILAAIVAVAVIAVIVAVFVSSKPSGSSSVTDSKTQQTQATEEPIVTPTFNYFVSQNDASYAAAMEVVAKLQQEYEGKVNFDIRDVDADPTIAENFSLVIGQTPALIMLDIHNNPCAFVFASADETELKAAIDKALGE